MGLKEMHFKHKCLVFRQKPSWASHRRIRAEKHQGTRLVYLGETNWPFGCHPALSSEKETEAFGKRTYSMTLLLVVLSTPLISWTRTQQCVIGKVRQSLVHVLLGLHTTNQILQHQKEAEILNKWKNKILIH